mgnify:CR=1 FL=1
MYRIIKKNRIMIILVKIALHAFFSPLIEILSLYAKPTIKNMADIMTALPTQ